MFYFIESDNSKFSDSSTVSKMFKNNCAAIMYIAVVLTSSLHRLCLVVVCLAVKHQLVLGGKMLIYFKNEIIFNSLCI